MFFTLRFTLKREIMNPISNYILSKYGQEAHDHTRPAFKEINKIRDSIDYYHIERLLKNSQKAGTDTAVENLLFYYTVLKNIYSYFEYAFYDHNGIEIPIPWSPAFLPLKAVLSNHFSYEYASVIFNLAFVYCNIGTKLVESPQESDLREALTKLKYALYLLEELKDIVPKIPLKSEDIPDMNPDYLNLIIDYITGMAYVALSKIDKLTDNKENVVDSHLKAAGIYFEAAYKKFVGSNCCYLLDEDKQNFEACLKACISAYPSTIPAGDAIEPILPVQPIPKGQIDFDQLFEILLSPEIAKLKADLKATIETYRLKTLLLRSKLDNLIGNQRKFYESSYLNSWLSLLTPHPVLPNKIARKIQKFREHKGRGAYLQAKKALIDFKENCQQTIRFIKGLLGSEKNQDNEIRNRLKDDPRLKEIEPSDYANKDLVASLEGKIRIIIVIY
jgi:BRO1-like domain.